MSTAVPEPAKPTMSVQLDQGNAVSRQQQQQSGRLRSLRATASQLICLTATASQPLGLAQISSSTDPKPLEEATDATTYIGLQSPTPPTLVTKRVRLPADSLTFATLDQICGNEHSDEEVDELASSVDEIESFEDLIDTPQSAPPAKIPDALATFPKQGEQSKQSVDNIASDPNVNIPEIQGAQPTPAESDKIVFTPPKKSKTIEFTPPKQRPNEAEPYVDIHRPAASYQPEPCLSQERRRKNSPRPAVAVPGDFFKEERTYLKPLQSGPGMVETSREVTKRAEIVKKARIPLTQISMEGLTALAASRRQKKSDRNGNDFVTQQRTRGGSKVPKKDFKNVNGYLVLRDRHDLVRTPPLRATPAAPPASDISDPQHVMPKQANLPPRPLALNKTEPQPEKIFVPLKPKQDSTPGKQAASKPSLPAPVAESTYDLSKLAPFKCFGSFRLLQNSSIDRALGQHNIEVIYPEEADPVSIRALNLSKAKRQQIHATITHPDIILSPRSCLFYYRLSDIYKLTTVLNSNFEQRRMHHSKILIDAIKLFGVSYDQIVLVFEMFDSVENPKDLSKVEEPGDPITPPIKRALEKLHSDIGILMDEIQRPLGDELEIEMLFATNPKQAAAFAREKLDPKYAKDVQLGQLGWVSMRTFIYFCRLAYPRSIYVRMRSSISCLV